VKALTKLGHTCDVFWRSESVWPWARPGRLRMTRRMTLGRAMRSAAATAPSFNPDFLLRNRRLLQAARRFGPDVVLLIGGNEVILPETLAALKREHGAALVYACGTSPLVFSRPIERSAARLYDLVIANDLYHAIQWKELGARLAEVLPLSAVDPEFHRPANLTAADQERFGCDVGFVGTLVPQSLYSERIAALEALREFDLAIWSIHEVPPSLRHAYRGPALGEEMLRATSAAKIVVNPHGDFMRYGGNMRLFEACGAGTFQICDDRPGVHEWFQVGTHLVTYGDTGELKKQVAYYLSHPDERERIASAGQAHVYAHHTYDQRMARLIEMIERGGA
jgi:spore maturation protein CgeB